MTGGYPAFLLQKAQETGFLKTVATRATDGALAYIGVSAGAALAGPDMAPLIASDDPGNVSNTAGMALVPFVPLPHINRRPPNEVTKRRQAFPALDFMPLTDGEAIEVASGASRIVASL